MCGDVEIFKRFHAAVLPSKDMMIAEGFSSFAVEDFYDSFMEQLEKLGPNSDDRNLTAVKEPETNGSSEVCLRGDAEQLEDKLGKKRVFITWRITIKPNNVEVFNRI